MEGLDKFRDAFRDFSDNYVIIGGTACEIAMSRTEVKARATHDIDMIVIVEKMTEAYGINTQVSAHSRAWMSLENCCCALGLFIPSRYWSTFQSI